MNEFYLNFRHPLLYIFSCHCMLSAGKTGYSKNLLNQVKNTVNITFRLSKMKSRLFFDLHVLRHPCFTWANFTGWVSSTALTRINLPGLPTAEAHSARTEQSTRLLLADRVVLLVSNLCLLFGSSSKANGPFLPECCQILRRLSSGFCESLWVSTIRWQGL